MYVAVNLFSWCCRFVTVFCLKQFKILNQVKADICYNVGQMHLITWHAMEFGAFLFSCWHDWDHKFYAYYILYNRCLWCRVISSLTAWKVSMILIFAVSVCHCFDFLPFWLAAALVCCYFGVTMFFSVAVSVVLILECCHFDYPPC
jgi:hypothetical protein